MTFPETDKKIRQRISSYKSAMNKEKKTHGSIHDGSGKRYLIFWFYFVLNDLKKAADYYDWYSTHFPEDVGEPCQKICWATLLFRMGEKEEAKFQLADAMLSNLYMIPFLLEPEAEHPPIDTQQSLPWTDQEYLEEIPETVIKAFTPEDLNWIKSCYNSSIFQTIRNRHVEIFNEIKNIDSTEERMALLEEDHSLLDMLDDSSDVRILFQVAPDPNTWH